MRAFDLDGTGLRVDVEATRELHAALSRGAAEACGCADCENYLLQRAELLDAGLRSFLGELGIEAERESDLCVLEAAEDDGWTYVLRYHCVGEPSAGGTGKRLALPADLAVEVRPGSCLAPLRPDRGELLELEFELRLPWQLPRRRGAASA